MLADQLKEKITGVLKSKSAVAIGLDIGSYSVKCVGIRHDDGEAALQSAQLWRLPSGSTEGLVETLRKALPSIGASPKHFRISVSGPSVFVRNITLPRMTPAELKSAIRFEAERHIPFSLDDSVLDFQTIGYANNKLSMRVLLVAAKREYINQRIKVLADMGLEPEIIDTDIFCFANAFRNLNPDNEMKTYGLLSVGHGSSSFAIIHDGELFFVREMLFGGQGVAKALAAAKNISEEAADEWKRKTDPEHRPDLVSAAQKGFEPLVDELKRSLDYFENETGEDLKVIVAAGGGAKCQGACEVLSEELGKKVSLWSGARRLERAGEIDEKFFEEHLPDFHVAYGLALRGVKNK